MKTKLMTMMLAFLVLAVNSAFAGSQFLTNDTCGAEVADVVKGIAKSYRKTGKTVKVLNLELSSETEYRNYSLDVEADGCIDSYDIELSNDSASMCAVHRVTLKQSCG